MTGIIGNFRSFETLLEQGTATVWLANAREISRNLIRSSDILFLFTKMGIWLQIRQDFLPDEICSLGNLSVNDPDAGMSNNLLISIVTRNEFDSGSLVGRFGPLLFSQYLTCSNVVKAELSLILFAHQQDTFNYRIDILEINEKLLASIRLVEHGLFEMSIR